MVSIRSINFPGLLIVCAWTVIAILLCLLSERLAKQLAIGRFNLPIKSKYAKSIRPAAGALTVGGGAGVLYGGKKLVGKGVDMYRGRGGATAAPTAAPTSTLLDARGRPVSQAAPQAARGGMVRGALGGAATGGIRGAATAGVAGAAARGTGRAVGRGLEKTAMGMLNPTAKGAMDKAISIGVGHASGTLPWGTGAILQPVVKQITDPLVNIGAQGVFDLGSKVIRMATHNPERFGKYAPVIQDAINRGTNSLASTLYVLERQDPEFKETMDGIRSEED